MPVFPGDPLITTADYQLVTSDTSSAATGVEGAIIDAIDLVEQHTHRTVEYGEYTETLRVDSNGRVWPRATPLEAVSTPETAEILDASIITGYLGTLFPDRTLNSYWWDRPPTVEVTYTGGWTRDTIPADLRRLICQIAYDILHPPTANATLAELPTSATSARVGDVALSSSSGISLVSPPTLSATSMLGLRAWRKPQLVDV